MDYAFIFKNNYSYLIVVAGFLYISIINPFWKYNLNCFESKVFVIISTKKRRLIRLINNFHIQMHHICT